MIEGREPGGFRDRCGRCGGWISMGHAIGSACRPAIEPDEIRIFPCGNCGGDGGHHDFAGHWFLCTDCKGDGFIEVELTPVEMEDLATPPEKRSISRQTVQKRERIRKNVQPPHRVVQREVIDWANSLNGRAPVGGDLSRLIASLAAAVEADRCSHIHEDRQAASPLSSKDSA